MCRRERTRKKTATHNHPLVRLPTWSFPFCIHKFPLYKYQWPRAYKRVREEEKSEEREKEKENEDKKSIKKGRGSLDCPPSIHLVQRQGYQDLIKANILKASPWPSLSRFHKSQAFQGFRKTSLSRLHQSQASKGFSKAKLLKASSKPS